MSKFLTFKIYESIKVAAAYEFAARAHSGQKRKYTGEPYIVHPVEVATILAGIGCEDEDMLCAALLHDVVEDCEVQIEQIEAEFGKRVAELVWGLTDDKIEGNRATRKRHDLERLKETSPDVKTIKCCDLVSNTRDIALHDKGFAKVYLAEKRALLVEALSDADPVALARAERQWHDANEEITRSDNPS